jgi:hypothetical protein
MLDNRPVTAAVLAWRSRLQSDARHNANTQVDVMRRIGIKLHEITFAERRAPTRAFKTQGGVQRPLVICEELLQDRLRLALFGKDALRRDLSDIRGG